MKALGRGRFKSKPKLGFVLGVVGRGGGNPSPTPPPTPVNTYAYTGLPTELLEYLNSITHTTLPVVILGNFNFPDINWVGLYTARGI